MGGGTLEEKLLDMETRSREPAGMRGVRLLPSRQETRRIVSGEFDRQRAELEEGNGGHRKRP